MKGFVYMVRSLTDHSSISKCYKSIRNDISESGLATPMCVFVYVHVLAKFVYARTDVCVCVYACVCVYRKREVHVCIHVCV